MSKGDISTLPERGHFYFAPTLQYNFLYYFQINFSDRSSLTFPQPYWILSLFYNTHGRRMKKEIMGFLHIVLFTSFFISILIEMRFL